MKERGGGELAVWTCECRAVRFHRDGHGACIYGTGAMGFLLMELLSWKSHALLCGKREQERADGSE